MDNEPNIIELIEQVVELKGAERRAFLDRVGAEDPELRAELESILEGEDDLASEFLGEPAVEAFPELVADIPDAKHPEHLGPYRVTGVLGEGGMGCVYSAEQTEPVRRTVAIKLIRTGLTSPGSVARFEAERQAMARLSHPAIAQMLEAGTTDDGFPYFVMEHVEGATLTEFCDREQLDVEARLRLFIQICHGVEHAHRKGILHRDLKPANILVTRIDGAPAPKIIDFGIAKAVTGSLTDETMLTRFGIGTPNYMSPEAFVVTSAGTADVDTRTDVYALGITLYQLLVGKPPLDTRGMSISKIAQQISRDSPTRPAGRFRELSAEEQVEIAASRNTLPDQLQSRLSGDLEWIVLHAIEKERRRRYGSARELAEDISRYLAYEPVSVGPPSRRYQLGLLVRRHPALTIGASMAVLALVAGGIGTTTGMVRARQEAERATLEVEKTLDALETAEEATDFLVHLFEVSDPRDAGGETLTAQQLLIRGEQRIERRLADEPIRRAELLGTLSDIYLRLDMPEESHRLASAALELQQQRLLPDHHSVMASRERLIAIERVLESP